MNLHFLEVFSKNKPSKSSLASRSRKKLSIVWSAMKITFSVNCWEAEIFRYRTETKLQMNIKMNKPWLCITVAIPFSLLHRTGALKATVESSTCDQAKNYQGWARQLTNHVKTRSYILTQETKAQLKTMVRSIQRADWLSSTPSSLLLLQSVSLRICTKISR